MICASRLEMFLWQSQYLAISYPPPKRRKRNKGQCPNIQTTLQRGASLTIIDHQCLRIWNVPMTKSISWPCGQKVQQAIRASVYTSHPLNRQCQNIRTVFQQGASLTLMICASDLKCFCNKINILSRNINVSAGSTFEFFFSVLLIHWNSSIPEVWI